MVIVALFCIFRFSRSSNFVVKISRFVKLISSRTQQTNMILVTCQGLVICFYLGWSGSILQFRRNMIKVGSKSWLLTCSSNITLSQPSYTGSEERELNFCNSYLTLLYFWSYGICNNFQRTISR